MNTLEEAQHTLVKRGHDAKPVYERLEQPAHIVYNCVLYVVEHVPLLEIVPGVFPEWYFTGELDPEEETYDEYCKKFYDEVEEAHVAPRMSLNRGQFIKSSHIRIADDWIDAKLDSGWRLIRIPRSCVVILAPNTNIEHSAVLLEAFECDMIHSSY